MKKFTSYITNVNIIIVVVLLNVLLSFYPFLKFDLTRGRVHSLSSSTEEYIKTLDDIINIKVFLTEDLPPEAKPTAENLKTILEEFSRLNRSNLRIAYLDPNQNEEAAEEASKLGIQPLQFSSLKSDKFEIQKGYFGLAMIYGDKKQVLPVAGDVGNLEYFLVSGFRKLTEEKVTVVAMAESTEEEGSEVNYLRQFLMRDY
ncbi:MAG: GldG family protein, partial [Patescibacteria group bacterium]